MKTVEIQNKPLPEQPLWPKVPDDVHKAAKKVFAIPKSAKSVLLPENSLSIAKFLKWPFPSASFHELDINPDTFFSHSPPIQMTSEDLCHIQRIILPSTKLICTLETLSHQRWLNGACSVLYAHTGHAVHYPLWLVSYWNTVLSIQDQQYRQWCHGKKWIERQREQSKIPGRWQEAEAAAFLLLALPWRKDLSFGTEPVEMLSRFLGTEKASTALMDIMLQHMQNRVYADVTLTQQYLVRPLSVINKVIDSTEGDPLCLMGSFPVWLRDIGEQVFSQGKALVTAVHMSKLTGVDHWTPIIIDGARAMFLYGDSLTATPVMPSRLANALHMWRAAHTTRSYQISPLPITHQVDNVSCSFMAINALETFIFPNVELVDAHNVASMRLQMFNQIVTGSLNEDDKLMEEDSEDDDSSASDTRKPSAFPSSTMFTFFCPMPTVVTNKPASDFANNSDETRLKRPVHGNDAPTPNPSPEKKRTKPVSTARASSVPKLSLFEDGSVENLISDDDLGSDDESTYSNDSNEPGWHGRASYSKDGSGSNSEDEAESGGHGDHPDKAGGDDELESSPCLSPKTQQPAPLGSTASGLQTDSNTQHRPVSPAPTQATLHDFFKKESKEEKAKRIRAGFEAIENNREKNELQGKWGEAAKQKKRREGERNRQQKWHQQNVTRTFDRYFFELKF
ncbi:hypothetical protein VKT23_017488 [Stygiomarasmius scandens]|uniref:Ubiquitin-like protease family profile domain-containing protein n=1 Tax=Marasmiellus scandens TaxID=2682957 RepID=A0ABR1IUX8_9AGAR